ncbi:unnamed protein product, partial [Oikopleura dioica]
FWSVNHLGQLYEMEITQEKYLREKIRSIQSSNIRPDNFYPEAILKTAKNESHGEKIRFRSEAEIKEEKNSKIDQLRNHDLKKQKSNEKHKFVFYNRMPRGN